jgi:antitoxin component of RelBE/YafQ-DinJ toxin-antitoxin module
MKINPKQPRNEKGQLQAVDGKTKSKLIGIKVDPATHEKLKEIANNKGIDVSDMMRELIKKLIEDRERQTESSKPTSQLAIEGLETEKRMTNAEVAKLTGKHPNTISDYKNGKIKPPEGFPCEVRNGGWYKKS